MTNQPTKGRKTEYIDSHCHILPGVDHGAKDEQTAYSMAQALCERGFTKCFATPHFYFYEESADSFLARRDKAYSSMVFPEALTVLPGAEVAYEVGLSQRCDLSKLVIKGTDRVLIELPMKRFTPKTVEEFFDIRSRHDVKIIVAHAERYLPYMTFSDYMELAGVDDIIFQINLYSISRFYNKIFLKRLINSGASVIFGTDIHAVDERLTRSDKGLAYLSKALNPFYFDKMMTCEDILL